MHEISFAKAVLNDIESIKDKSKEIGSITLELGELVGISDLDLKNALEKLAGLQIHIINKKSKIRCPCGYVGVAEILERLHDQVIWKCPWCDEPNEVMTVLEGDKIKILKITYK